MDAAGQECNTEASIRKIKSAEQMKPDHLRSADAHDTNPDGDLPPSTRDLKSLRALQ